MSLTIINYQDCNFKAFCSFWHRLYDYKNEDLYERNIRKKKLSKEELKELFIWKNGGPLSDLKLKTFNKIADKLDVINRLKSDFDLEVFKNEFKFLKNAAIWKIFLLHVTCHKYPIFDQHVYRAFYFITKNVAKEIPSNNAIKEDVYFNEYVQFFNKLAEFGILTKVIDESLWAFGKFLKSPYADLLAGKLGVW